MPTVFPANAPIAVFDSGLGGLSVVRHVRACLPEENLIYFADCLWAPYGERCAPDILARVCVVADWLAAQHIKAMVVACNTATTIAVDTLRARLADLPVVGVEPGVKPAVAASRTQVVGVLATEATLRTDSFRALLGRQDPRCRFVCQAGHGLVALIEGGGLDSPAVDALLTRYLDPMLAQQVDTLVLGSTHFPLLMPAIARLYGDRLMLVETGLAVANQLRNVLAARARLRTGGMGRHRLVSSRTSLPLQRLAEACLGERLAVEIALD